MGNPKLRCVHVSHCLFIFVLHIWSSLTTCSISFAVKRRPKLKSKYQGRVEKAIEYAESIESWDDLLDPWTLAFYYLGPDPSPYVLPTPSSKRPRLSAKEKEKERVGSSVWDDEGVAVEQAYNVVKAKDLKVFSGVPLNVVAS